MPLRVEEKIDMHRLIMNPPKGMEVDHINGNRLDNRRENLRIVTSQQNKMNSGTRKHSSIYKGVSWNKNSKSWRANMTFNKKHISLGQYINEYHAALAYDLWALDLFKEFAKTNFKIVSHS